MSEEFNKFPYRYSQFIDKVNADWDGDPKGDYIMAEHINELQDAIIAIEEYLGVNPDSTQTLKERLEFIQSNFNEAMPIVHSFLPDNENNPVFNENNYRQTDLLIVPQINNDNSFYKNKNLESPEKIFGIINSQLPLNTFQTEIGEWLEINVGGIFLQDFGLVNSSLKQTYLDSVYEQGLKVIIQTNNINQLNELNLELKEKTYIWLEKFGYDNGYRSLTDYNSSFNFLIQELKNKDYHFIAQSDINSQTQFSYVQKLAYLYALDGLYIGPNIGKETFYQYDYSPPLVNWRLAKDEPLNINYQDSQLSRTMSNGSIYILPDGIAYYKGKTYNSSDITWHNNTIPGTSLTEGSIPPGKLSSYDVEKIINLINDSHSELQIDITKIRMDEIDALPANIPAANMQTNVVLAINRSSDPLSTNAYYIDSSLIKEIEASKIIGKLPPSLYEEGIIQAINANNNDTDNFINVKRIDVNQLNVSGDISGANNIQATEINADNITAGNLIRTLNSIVTGKHTAYEGEYEYLDVVRLNVDILEGLKNLHVENLQADNMNTLVLDAINANIEYGVFNQIVTKALTADTIQANLVTALNSVIGHQITNEALIGDATIRNGSIISLTANKIVSGTIDTGQVDLSSSEGHLRIQDKTIKIYDAADSDNNRKLRVVLGDTSATGIPEIDILNLGHGLLVLGEDGSTRLYDSTGVHSAGLHNNIISEEKMQDDSISSRTIQIGAIIADHIQAEQIKAGHIDTDAIDSRHIKAGAIESGHIEATAIKAGHIDSGQIETAHLKADIIEAQHIKAGAIHAEHLTIGYLNNLIHSGYDSFEQVSLGVLPLINETANIRAEISKQWAWDGNRSLRLSGPNTINTAQLATSSYSIIVKPKIEYIISAYVRTFSDNNIIIRLGFKDENTSYTSSNFTINNSLNTQRFFYKFKTGENTHRGNILLTIEASNTEVYFDGIQIEEVTENITTPGTWKSTSTTTISGDTITTGRINSQFIQIGNGTIFGNDNIIKISDQGIRAESINGYAMLNGNGLEITGGAISVIGGNSNNKISIKGNEGIVVENGQSKIALTTDKGLNIYNKVNNEVIFSIDPTTGELLLSGTAKFITRNNSEVTLEDIETRIENSRRVFTSQPIPPYNEGDMWIKKPENIIYYATRPREENTQFVESDWEITSNLKDDSALKEFVQQYDKEKSIRLHMLVHYSSFNTQALNHLYFCGYDRSLTNFSEVAQDIDGEIYSLETQETIVVPKQSLDLTNLEEGLSGYLIFNNSDKKISFIYYDKEIEEYYGEGSLKTEERIVREGWKLYNPTTNQHNEYIEITSNTYIIGELER